MNEVSFLMGKSSDINITMKFDGPYSVRMSISDWRHGRKKLHMFEKNNGWNSTMGEMPEDGETVLCLDDCGNYHLAVRAYDLHDRCLWNEITTGEEITHDIGWWMPLPNRPKER